MHKIEGIDYEPIVKQWVDIYSNRYTSLKENINMTPYKSWLCSLKDLIKKITEGQTAYNTSEQAFNLILASHIHMFNNRIGIYPQYESVIASVVNVILQKEGV